MKIRKKSVLSVVALLLTLSLALFGCSSGSKGSNASSGNGGNKASKTPESSASTSDEKVKLTWLVRTDPAMLDWENDIIKGFHDAHPNITVELQRIPQEEIDQRMATMIAGGQMADIFSSNWTNSGFPTYFHLGAMLDLTPYFEQDSDVLSSINKSVTDLFVVDGKNYGMPMLTLGSFIFYNKDLFDAAGVPYPTTDWDDQSWNYDKLLEVSQKLTHDVGTNNQVFGFLNNMNPDEQVWNWGGDFYKPEAYETGYIDGNVDAVTDINKKALQYNVDMINKYKVSPDQATVDAVSAVGDPFMTGKVAMVTNGGWGFWEYDDANFKWGVAPIPYADGRHASLYSDAWNIFKDTKHPAEAWEFIKYLTDPTAGGKTFMEQTSATPANATLVESWYKQMSDKTGMTVDQIKQVHEGAIKYGRDATGAHTLVNSSVIGNTINQTMAEVWNGNKTVDEGLAEIQTNLSALKIKSE